MGHPRIFINVDKPQICFCTYCGVPYVSLLSSGNAKDCLTGLFKAHEHHRKVLEAQPSTTYPLKPTGDPAEVPESQRVTDEALGHR